MTDLARVHITRDNVYFNGIAVPCYIAENGVTFVPGGQQDCNRLIVEFLVGDVVSDDPTFFPDNDCGTPIYDQLMLEAPKPPAPDPLWLNPDTVCRVCGRTPEPDEDWKMGWDTPGYWVHVECDKEPPRYIRDLERLQQTMASMTKMPWWP
jgi:hypothetical protein